MKPRTERSWRCPDEVQCARKLKRPGAVVAALASLGVGAAIGFVPAAASTAISPPPRWSRIAETRTLRAQSAEPSRSVWDGVYTEAQAKRGKRVFQRYCSDCHQVSEFGGGYASVYEFFESRKLMPETTPGSLSAKTYADLTAYVLEANGFPAGDDELRSDRASLENIRFEAKSAASTPD